jgi:hypothetical protein
MAAGDSAAAKGLWWVDERLDGRPITSKGVNHTPAATPAPAETSVVDGATVHELGGRNGWAAPPPRSTGRRAAQHPSAGPFDLTTGPFDLTTGPFELTTGPFDLDAKGGAGAGAGWVDLNGHAVPDSTGGQHEIGG